MLWYEKLSKPEDRALFKEKGQYRWFRLIGRWKQAPARGTLVASIATRRDILEVESLSEPTLDRETHLVERHLQLLDRDMRNRNDTIDDSSNRTVVLVWSSDYPFWFANVKMGVDKTCNVPCEWTMDRNYGPGKVSGHVCLLYRMEHGQCQDMDPAFAKHHPVLGVSWENDWKTQSHTDQDQSPAAQLWELKRRVPYNLISSHELDSHIPMLYPDIADFLDEFQVQPIEELVRNGHKRQMAVMFAISNCNSPIRPDRLRVIESLSSYVLTKSYGKCLGENENVALTWNSRTNYKSSSYRDEMGKFVFVYAPENSYGVDYVTEKVYGPLRSGAVPIYMGSPNIAAFLPDRDAAIHVSDFSSIVELGKYLQRLSQNRTFLVERHHSWRTRPLPDRLLQLSKLVDRKSPYSYTCKVCNCFRGKIGCPSFG